jgi:hypothetical protein
MIAAWLRAKATLIIAGMLLAGVVAGGWQLYSWGLGAGRAELAAYKAAQALESDAVKAEAATKERELQTEADKQRKAKDARIKKLAGDLNVALERLRNRPTRVGAGGVPPVAGAGSGASCTGTGLYREDGEFLVREAARGKRILADLAECQTLYQAARDALN